MATNTGAYSHHCAMPHPCSFPPCFHRPHPRPSPVSLSPMATGAPFDSPTPTTSHHLSPPPLSLSRVPTGACAFTDVFSHLYHTTPPHFLSPQPVRPLPLATATGAPSHTCTLTTTHYPARRPSRLALFLFPMAADAASQTSTMSHRIPLTLAARRPLPRYLPYGHCGAPAQKAIIMSHHLPLTPVSVALSPLTRAPSYNPTTPDHPPRTLLSSPMATGVPSRISTNRVLYHLALRFPRPCLSTHPWVGHMTDLTEPSQTSAMSALRASLHLSFFWHIFGRCFLHTVLLFDFPIGGPSYYFGTLFLYWRPFPVVSAHLSYRPFLPLARFFGMLFLYRCTFPLNSTQGSRERARTVLSMCY